MDPYLSCKSCLLDPSTTLRINSGEGSTVGLTASERVCTLFFSTTKGKENHDSNMLYMFIPIRWFSKPFLLLFVTTTV